MGGRRVGTFLVVIALLGVLPAAAWAANASVQPGPTADSLSSPPPLTAAGEGVPPGEEPPPPEEGAPPEDGTPPNGEGVAAGEGPEIKSPTIFESVEGALPFTGFELGIALLAGGVLASFGLALRRIGRAGGE